MNLKDKILVTMLLTLGLLFHYISPGIFLGMKMDFLLIFMIVSIFLYPKFESYLLVSILGGIFSAMTTAMHGGQLANMIDKIISMYIVFLLVKVFKDRLNDILALGLLAFLGTLISGSIFIFIMKNVFLVSDMGYALIYLLVLPTALVNTIATILIYKLIRKTIYILTY